MSFIIILIPSSVLHTRIAINMRFGTSLLAAALMAAKVEAVLRQYTLVVTHSTIAPDGVSRRAWLVNGTTPGPTIVADEGDQLSINVINKGDEPITIHWHGIEQLGTPWSDGVPGITQYPIPIGKSFVYNWTATQMGYHWYHSHQHLQVDDGLRGDIYLRPKPGRQNPFGLISSDAADIAAMKVAERNPHKLFIYDWKHKTADEYMEEWKRTMVEPLCLDDILINGKGQVVCPSRQILDPVVNPTVGKATDKGCAFPNNTKNTTTELEVFQVNPASKWAAFNVVNAASIWDLRVSIDNHTLYTFAADGSYIRPIQSEVIGFIPDQMPKSAYGSMRFSSSVFPSGAIPLDKPLKDYTVRVAASVLPQRLSGYAVLQYNAKAPVKRDILRTETPTRVKRTVYTTPHPKNPYIDYAGQAIGSARELNPIDIKPFPANPPPKPSPDQIVTIRLDAERTSELGWFLNNKTWTELPDSATPVLFDYNQGNAIDSHLKFTTLKGQYVDVIMVVTSGNPSLHPPHPIHKHGVKAWFLGWGSGGFPYKTVAEAQAAGLPGLNLVDPQYRDTFVTPPGLGGQNWIAFRFQSTDPGPMFMHCHIDPHLAVGMAVVLLEGIDQWPKTPSYYTSRH
ncbi:multicopper oxidase family [Rhizoctonia solani]|uniref:Multicopper oxidase family n=1 Tax=Rhizoctonia solani TaxID=456999 RepID=A0A8H7IFN1_9AGAM|nr:multicopper oxidase family [Rhizoctonia solani]